MSNLSPKVKIFLILAKLLKKRNQTFPVVLNFTRKIELVSNILSMIVDTKTILCII